MDSRFQRIRERTGELGAHFRKYLLIIDHCLPRLLERLEALEVRDRIRLWNITRTPEQDLRLLASTGSNQRESLDFMACFYAMQYLQLTVYSLDMLELDVAEAQEPKKGWRRLLDFHAQRALRLHGAYLGALVELFLQGQPQAPRWVACVVGTRWDQDDLDLGVVHDGQEGLGPFRKALARSFTEMFRHAVAPHLYISEQLAMNGYSATVPEYGAMLDDRLQDFVLISELLSASPLAGDPALFQDFAKGILGRYYDAQGPGLRFHEGFLRGLLGDLQALMVRDFHGTRLDFKEDALRLVKGMLLAFKVTSGVRETDLFEATERLKELAPHRASDFDRVRDALVMVETMRFLYQVYSVQEEGVPLDGTQDEALDLVGRSMGFMETGRLRPGQQLLVHYYTSVHEIREIAQRHLDELTSYLRSISVYTKAMCEEAGHCAPAGPPNNLALELAEMIRLFGGAVFWDDVITEMRRDGFRFARRIVADLQALEVPQRQETLRRFLDFGLAEPLTLVKFLLVLQEEGSEASQGHFRDLVDLFFAQAPEHSDFPERMGRLFKSRPRIFNRFVESLDPARRARLEELLAGGPLTGEVADTLEQIRRFIELRTRGSEFYRRIFRRVMTKYPRFIHYVTDARRLHRFSDGLFTRALSLDDNEIARQALADYYDVQYLACAVRAILGEEPLEYRSRFIEFADNYLRSTYRLCALEEAESRGEGLGGKDLFGVFATGGYAREQAFDDDYDLLLVLNSDDPALYESVSRVWARVHMLIARRGTLPQYRFGDHFGGFVTRVSDLKAFLAGGEADLVDKAQLLGIRQIIGSTRLGRFLKDALIEPQILARADEFVAGIAVDMEERARGANREAGVWVDIKEAPGGMRDIEQTMLALSARFAVAQPVTYRLYEQLAGLAPDLAGDLAALREAHHFLREVRDLYRILVAAADDIHLEWLGPVARVVASHRQGFDGSPEQLFTEVNGALARVETLVWKLLGAAGAVRATCKDQKAE